MKAILGNVNFVNLCRIWLAQLWKIAKVSWKMQTFHSGWNNQAKYKYALASQSVASEFSLPPEIIQELPCTVALWNMYLNGGLDCSWFYTVRYFALLLESVIISIFIKEV